MSDFHYSDIVMGAMASEITSLTIVYSTVYSGADQRKHQSSASLGFVRGIHRWPVNSPHKGPVTRKMFPFDDVIMRWWHRPLLSRKLTCCGMFLLTNVSCSKFKFRLILQLVPISRCGYMMPFELLTWSIISISTTKIIFQEGSCNGI